MNDTSDLENNSCGSAPRFFHENPNVEYDKFVNISTTNLDAIEKLLLTIEDENIWDEVIMYQNLSEQISKQMESNCAEMAVLDGEIKYYERIIHKLNEDIPYINQLIQECVATLKELENEKAELTRNTINKHRAIKQATKYYKKRLNIHISYEHKNNIDFVKINLFAQKERDEYSFIFSINNIDKKPMRLENTNPKINDTRFSQIQTKFEEDQNICALLCSMRKEFLALK